MILFLWLKLISKKWPNFCKHKLSSHSCVYIYLTFAKTNARVKPRVLCFLIDFFSVRKNSNVMTQQHYPSIHFVYILNKLCCVHLIPPTRARGGFRKQEKSVRPTKYLCTVKLFAASHPASHRSRASDLLKSLNVFTVNPLNNRRTQSNDINKLADLECE